jgi:hypothetical protein
MKRFLCRAAIAGQIVFVLGWVVGGALQGHGYSVARHAL